MDKPLKKQHLKFVQCIVDGMTGESSYAAAYPNSIEWKKRAREAAAGKLLARSDIKNSIKSMREESQRLAIEAAAWNREKSARIRIETIEDLRSDMQRRLEAVFCEAESFLKNPPKDASPGDIFRMMQRTLQKAALDPASARAIAALTDSLDKLLGLDKKDDSAEVTELRFSGVDEL
jgi:hypothetical protein